METLFRDYPYPDGPTAPNNVPYDLQQLAEALDADVQSIADQVDRPERGTYTITSPIAAGSAQTSAVAFAEAFAAVPHITVTLIGGQAGTTNLTVRAINPTTTGFTLAVYNVGAASATWSGTMQVQWRATV